MFRKLGPCTRMSTIANKSRLPACTRFWKKVVGRPA